MLNSIDAGILNIVPELDDALIRSTPRLNNIGKLVISYDSLQSTHKHKSLNRTTMIRQLTFPAPAGAYEYRSWLLVLQTS